MSTTRQVLRRAITRTVGDQAEAEHPAAYYDDRINAAIRDSFPAFCQLTENTELTTLANTTDYAITVDAADPAFDHIVGDLRIEEGTGEDYSLMRNWRVENGILRFETVPTTTKILRFTYASPYTELSADTGATGTTELDRDYIEAYVCRDVWAARVGLPQYPQALAQAQSYGELVKRLKRERATPRPASRLSQEWVPE